MPIYAFRCQKCGFEFEELVPRVGQTAPCPKCGQNKDIERLVTAPAAHRGGASGGASSCGASPGFS